MTRLRKTPLPRLALWTWFVSALLGLVGLSIKYGRLDQVDGLSPVSDQALRWIFLAVLGVFVLGRLWMLIPFRGVDERLRRWWLDYVLIAAGLIWWSLDSSRQWALLDVATVYIVFLGFLAAGSAFIEDLSFDGLPPGLAAGATRMPRLGRRLVVAALLVVLVGGSLLALPVCWSGPYPVSWDATYPGQTRYELGRHWLDCLFTATAALTGTGLCVRDIGCEFRPAGHLLLLVLMEIGGLVVLAVGTVVGWRLRYLAGWGREEDDVAPRTLRRLVATVLAVAIVVQLVGMLLLRPMASCVPESDPAARLHPWLGAAFHAVSAFCNVGLTLTENSLVACRGSGAVYGVILPLMVLGSVGGPVLYDVLLRVVKRGRGARLPYYTRRVLPVTLVIILLGAGLLNWIETTPFCQLRNPRPDTPGRLMVKGLPTPATQPASSLDAAVHGAWGDPAASERLAGMAPGPRRLACLFQSVSARTAGFRTVRMDEASLSPAGRLLLMVLMLIGGDVGGTAGGLRLLVLALLASTLFFKPGGSQRFAGRPAAWNGPRSHVLAVAVAAAFALGLIVATSALVLVYREAGSPMACLFEAVSASCNVGFSAGLTGRLSVQGRVVVILAMLAGRVVPLAILMRSAQIREALAAPELKDLGSRLVGAGGGPRPQEPDARGETTPGPVAEGTAPADRPTIPLEPSGPSSSAPHPDSGDAGK